MAITAQPCSILQLLWWRKPCVFFLFARSKHGCLHQRTPASAWLSLHPSRSGYRVPGKRRGTTTKCLTSASDLALPSPLGYDTLHLGVYVRWFPGRAGRAVPSRQDPARQLQERGGVDWVQLGSTTHAVPVPSPSGKEVFPRQQVKHRRNGLETTAEPALTAPGETAAILLLFWLNFVVCGVIVGKEKTFLSQAISRADLRAATALRGKALAFPRLLSPPTSPFRQRQPCCLAARLPSPLPPSTRAGWGRSQPQPLS